MCARKQWARSDASFYLILTTQTCCFYQRFWLWPQQVVGSNPSCRLAKVEKHLRSSFRVSPWQRRSSFPFFYPCFLDFQSSMFLGLHGGVDSRTRSRLWVLVQNQTLGPGSTRLWVLVPDSGFLFRTLGPGSGPACALNVAGQHLCVEARRFRARPPNVHSKLKLSIKAADVLVCGSDPGSCQN